MFISIIIPAYNSAQTLRQCIASIRNQKFTSRYEIVLVDNGSTDDTVALARRMSVDKIVLSPDTTVYGARNEAVRESKGDVLAFIDSDCIADPNWLTEGTASLQNYDVVAGHICPQKSNRHILYNYDYYVARARNDMPGREVNIAAGNAFVPVDIFKALKGFDASLQTAADSIFSMRARKFGYTIGLAPDSIVYHPVDGFIRRIRGEFREGKGSALKTPYSYEYRPFLSRVLLRLKNFLISLKNDLNKISIARKKGNVGILLYMCLFPTVIFFILTSYISAICARVLRPISEFIARR